MNYKDTLLLTARLLSDNPVFENSESGPAGKFDWEMLVQVASSQLIFPSLYLRLSNFYPQDQIPNDLLEYFKHIYILNRERNQQIINQALEINDLFYQNNIECVFIKGVASIFDNVYKDIGERMIGDIDILVSDEDFISSVGLLKSSGYQQSTNFDNEQFNLLKHYPRLICRDRIAAVEIHRQPVNLQYIKIIDAGQIIRNKRIDSTYQKIYVPDDKDKAIVNFVHSQISNRNHYYACIHLRHVYEFYLLQKRIKDQLTELPLLFRRRYRLYLNLAFNLIEGSKNFSPDYRIYLFRIYSNLRSPQWRKFNHISLYISEKLIYYTLLLFKGIFNNRTRKILINKIQEKGRLRSNILSLKNEIRRLYLIK